MVFWGDDPIPATRAVYSAHDALRLSGAQAPVLDALRIPCTVCGCTEESGNWLTAAGEARCTVHFSAAPRPVRTGERGRVGVRAMR